jgi:urea transport system permease protein
VALSQLTNVGPNLGQNYIVDSFMVVVFGGVGSLWGTQIGGTTLGVVNKVLEPMAGGACQDSVLVGLIPVYPASPARPVPAEGSGG